MLRARGLAKVDERGLVQHPAHQGDALRAQPLVQRLPQRAHGGETLQLRLGQRVGGPVAVAREGQAQGPRSEEARVVRGVGEQVRAEQRHVVGAGGEERVGLDDRRHRRLRHGLLGYGLVEVGARHSLQLSQDGERRRAEPKRVQPVLHAHELPRPTATKAKIG